MTKKDYQQFATLFGALRREESSVTLNQVIDETIDIFKRDNSRFDAEKFWEWIYEVTNHERDLDGKRITKQKEAQSV